MRELGIGRPVPRTEDARLLRGLGRYVDDIQPSAASSLYVVRSPHANARILKMNASAARAAPGVLAVLMPEDAAKAKFTPFPSRVPRHKANGEPNYVPPYGPLAIDRVPHAGDAVAAVIAETLHQAKDAAELLEIEYETLPAVTDTAGAAEPDAPVVWPENGDNICFLYRLGNKSAADAAFVRAAHVVKRRFVITRMSTMSITVTLSPLLSFAITLESVLQSA